MIKAFFATSFICLAIGSIIGYTISENMRSQSNNQDAIASTQKPKTAPLTRKELEARFHVCIGRVVKLDRFSEKDLNDELFECESAKK